MARQGVVYRSSNEKFEGRLPAGIKIQKYETIKRSGRKWKPARVTIFEQAYLNCVLYWPQGQP